MEQKNRGVIVVPPRPTDYIFGAILSIQTARHIDDWLPLLPEKVSQRNSIQDFLDCVTVSGINSIESNLNYLLLTNQFSDEALNFFKDGGYITNGKFKLSQRFNAKMNGTDISKGQNLTKAGDCFRRDGFVPEKDWPMTDKMGWNEFYSDIPQNIKDKAKKALWFLTIQYQFIGQQDISLSLKSAPIQIASEICAGWDTGNIVPRCSGQPPQHATMIYGMAGDGTYYDMDHYPPYFQKLAHNYELPYNLQYIVSVKPIALRNGMAGANVLNLQQNLRNLGYSLSMDGFFGPTTEKWVKDFQVKHGLITDGIAGPLTLSKIKSLTIPQQSKIDIWCGAIKIIENARPSRNNPGNLRYIGQKYAMNDNGFCKFDTYQHGYEALKDQIISACSGNNKYYDPNGNFYDFYAVYAPDSDGNNSKAYAEFVAQKLGVSPLAIIKTML